MKTLRKGSVGCDVKIVQRVLNLLADGIFGSLTEESVKDFQYNNGLVADGIVGPKTWEKIGKISVSSIHKSKRNIKEIIVHCSATPEGKDFTVKDIKAWHLARHFNDIGYHYVIYRDGSIHEGRSVDISGAHCPGHNSYSIGVCYIGGETADGSHTPKDTRTPEQKESLLKLLTELKKIYPKATIHSHKDFANKACPSFNATLEYSSIR